MVWFFGESAFNIYNWLKDLPVLHLVISPLVNPPWKQWLTKFFQEILPLADQNWNAFSEGWPKALRPIQNLVYVGFVTEFELLNESFKNYPNCSLKHYESRKLLIFVQKWNILLVANFLNDISFFKKSC